MRDQESYKKFTLYEHNMIFTQTHSYFKNVTEGKVNCQSYSQVKEIQILKLR